LVCSSICDEAAIDAFKKLIAQMVLLKQVAAEVRIVVASGIGSLIKASAIAGSLREYHCCSKSTLQPIKSKCATYELLTQCRIRPEVMQALDF